MVRAQDLRKLNGRGMTGLFVVVLSLLIVTLTPSTAQACPYTETFGCTSGCDMDLVNTTCGDWWCGVYSSCVVRTCQEYRFAMYEDDGNGNCNVLCGAIIDFTCNCLQYVCP